MFYKTEIHTFFGFIIKYLKHLLLWMNHNFGDSDFKLMTIANRRIERQFPIEINL